MNDEIEIWKDVKGYEGLYKVSNKGRVYSFITNRYMIPQLTNTGYHYIDLTKNKETKRITIHRLVAFTFVHNPNPEKFKIVNHKDENKLNNNASNLEWCDTQYNNTYGNRLEKAKETYENMDPKRKAELIELKRINSYNFRNNMTEEEKIAYNKKISDGMRNMSEEEKCLQKQHIQQTWQNKSDEEKAAFSKSQSEKTKEVWNNKTEEEKKQWGIDIKERWQGYSDEYKQKFSEKMSQVNKENWENKTEESKEEFKNIMKDVWKNKTDEQREAYRKIQSKLNRERFDNMSEEDKEKMRIQARQNGFICAFMCQLKLNEKLFLSPADITDKNIITDDECGVFVLPNMYITQYLDKDRNKPIFHSGSLM